MGRASHAVGGGIAWEPRLPSFACQFACCVNRCFLHRGDLFSTTFLLSLWQRGSPDLSRFVRICPDLSRSCPDPVQIPSRSRLGPGLGPSRLYPPAYFREGRVAPYILFYN